MRAERLERPRAHRDREGAELEIVSSLDALLSLGPAWDRLVRAMRRPSPFLLQGWLTEWWREYGKGAELAVGLARREGELVGALPLMVRRRAGVRILEFVGGRHAVLADVLVAPGEDGSIARELVAQLASVRHDAADFFGLPAESRLVASGSLALRRLPRLEAPVLDISAGWDATYREKTTSKKRNLHKRRRRQLAELGRVTTDVVRDAKRLPAALEEALRLHAMRFADRPDASEFTTPSGRRFHRAALGRIAGNDVARIVLLRLDDRAIAFHYYFALSGTMYVHRLAFDPAYAKFSPGLVNTLDALEAAASEGLAKVEFLGRDERYKLELADGFEPLERAVGSSGTALGGLYVGARLGEERLRAAVRDNEAVRQAYIKGLAPLRRVARWATGRRTATL
jgi:CelD/BcsL family acetyltransferase involved in cellulose biosynthesis